MNMMTKTLYPLELVNVRLVKDRTLYSHTPIHSPKEALDTFGDLVCDMDREMLAVMNMDVSGRVINMNIVSIGSLSSSVAHPREILKASILSNAQSIILLHNHPSGQLSPSKEDIELTDRMSKVCALVGIPLIDHVIVGPDRDRYFSFAAKELIDNRLSFADNIDDIELAKVAERKEGYEREVFNRPVSAGKVR
jgi:DNA repair protein RadC